jgi:predicted TIM-barrel fold metal-dependent hydrolase
MTNPLPRRTLLAMLRRLLLSAWLGVRIASAAAAQSPTTAPATRPGDDDIGVAVYVGDELLRAYRPESTLVTPVTIVKRAKFPAIDIHCHWTRRVEPAFLVAKMDAMNVSHAVNLSGGFGDEAFAMLERYNAHEFDGRLITFVNLDFAGFDDSAWPDRMTTFLDEAHRRGAKGLKLFKDFGLTIRDASGAVIPVDHPRLDAVWSKCAQLGWPVLIHSADPVAFFRPTDERNERWMQLRRHPSWSFHGPQFPGWDEVIAQRNRMIARHPRTQFIVAHLGEAGHDLQTLASWLDTMPNMHVDLSGRENEFGRQPFRARRFFIRYADRVLFGTDRYPGRIDQPRYTIYFRLLETEDEYFDYYDHPYPPAGEWKVYGLNLPDDVLRRIYRDNAAKLLKLQIPADASEPAR